MLRIIAGKHKNRIIPTQKNPKYRPSTGKLREAIFIILTSGEFIENPIVEGGNVLDLFAGTGSLGFEALSRGAAKITLIDIAADHLRDAKSFAAQIGEANNTSFLCMNALSLPKAIHKYDLVFMDPPYHKNFVEKTLASLIKGEWLRDGALIVVETAKLEDFTLPNCMESFKQKVYGNNKLVILRYTNN